MHGSQGYYFFCQIWLELQDRVMGFRNAEEHEYWLLDRGRMFLRQWLDLQDQQDRNLVPTRILHFPDTEWLPAVSHRLMQMGLPIARAPYARLPHPDRNLFIRPSPAMATASGHRTATVPPPAASGSPSAWTTQQPREIPAEKVAYVPDPHQAQAVGNQIDSPGLPSSTWVRGDPRFETTSTPSSHVEHTQTSRGSQEAAGRKHSRASDDDGEEEEPSPPRKSSMFEKRQDACAPPAVEGSEDIVREGDAPEDVRSTTPAIPGGVMDAERGPSEPLAPEYSNPQHPPQASRANRRGEEALRRLSEKQQGKNLNTASGNEPNFENTAQDDGSSGAGGGTTGTNNSHQATNANRAVSRSPPRPVQDHMPAANPGTTTTTNNFNLTIHGNLTYAPQDNRSTNINVSWPRGPMHQHEQQHPSRSQAPPRWHDPFGPHEQAQDRDGQRQSGRHRSGQPQPTQQSAYGQPFTFPCRGRRRPAGTTEMPGQPSGASAAHHRGSGANENGFVEDDYFNGAADCESGSQEHDTDMGEPSV